MGFFLHILLAVLYVCIGIFLPGEPPDVLLGMSLKRSFLEKIFEERAEKLDPQEREKIIEALIEAQRDHGIDALLLTAIIEEESHYNPKGISRKGARGLMQVMPLTAFDIAEERDIEWHGSDVLYDPEINIQIGAAYLAELKEEFIDWDLVLAIYNMGYRRFKELRFREEGPPWRYSFRVQKKFKRLQADYEAYQEEVFEPQS